MSNLSRLLRATVAVCTFALALSLHAAEEASNASGMLKVNGHTTNLRYAYAFHDSADNSTRVVIASRPLPAAMLAGEIALGTSGGRSPFRDLVQKGEAGAIQLFVKPDGVMETVMVFDARFETPMPATGDDSYWHEPYQMSAGWIGGRSRTKQQQEFFDTKWDYDVSWFAPVGRKTFDIAPAAAIAAQRKEIEAREKPRIVAPGGGEEGAMYLEFHKNLEAANTKGLLEQMTPAMKSAVAAEMQVPTLCNTDLGSWAMARSMPPGKVEIVGGVRDPDGTLLELRKTMDNRQKFGAAKIVKVQGAWKVAELKWW